MATAYRLDPIVPLNAAEIDACQQFEAEQAFATAGFPETWRKDFIRAYRSTMRGFAASDASSPALKAEVERREIERDTIYRETFGLPDMNITENCRHIKLMRSK